MLWSFISILPFEASKVSSIPVKVVQRATELSPQGCAESTIYNMKPDVRKPGPVWAVSVTSVSHSLSQFPNCEQGLESCLRKCYDFQRTRLAVSLYRHWPAKEALLNLPWWSSLSWSAKHSCTQGSHIHQLWSRVWTCSGTGQDTFSYMLQIFRWRRHLWLASTHETSSTLCSLI